MAAARAVDVEDLSSGYGGVTVLRNVTFHVDEGEVVALLGPNGAGKTTTLLTLSGIVSATAGRAEVLGEPPPSRPKAHMMTRRRVAHVPEDRGLFTQLSVRDNLRLGPARGPHAITSAVDLFPELEPLLGRRVGLLSGGEQQMVALARALVAEPKVLMIDEMSFGLAPVVVQRLLPLARRAAAAGAAVLLVEQHTDLALATSDRAYVLGHGEIVLEGAAADLLSNRELLDSAFLGSRS